MNITNIQMVSEWVRNCPSCNKEISYKHPNNFYRAKKKNVDCRGCSTSRIHTGRIRSPETKARISAGNMGKNPSREARIRMSISQTGRKHSKETKRKMRLATLARIEQNCGQVSPSYNPVACKLFEQINKELGWQGQHAENGGEYKVAGYWLDYYESNLNIAIEYDEPHHNSQRERDVRRQKEIEGELGCKFIRITPEVTFESLHNIIKEVIE